MKKKNIIIVGLLSSLFLVVLVLLISMLMVLNFFGSNVTDGYVENNEEYAEMYKEVLNENVRYGNGYVPLERILYFYFSSNELAFSKIYTENLEKETKQQLDLIESCQKDLFNQLDVCNEDEIENSNLIGNDQIKPFNSPLEISNLYVTSFFMEERTVYSTFSIHKAWDFAASNETPVYSVCDGKVIETHSSYKDNTVDINGGGGNQIRIECAVDNDVTYEVIYAHLYPNSINVSVGDRVNHWQQIAAVGQTGYATGPHLHFQVELDDMPIDGLSLVDFNYEKN